VPVAENVRSVGAQRRGIFSVSQNGALVYQSGVGQGRFRLTWFDRTGKKLGTAGDPIDLLGVSLSPDGKTVATSRFDPINFTWDLWQYDAARVLQTRFTFERSDAFLSAVWSPDGASIAYGSIRNGKYGVFRKAANLSGSEELIYAEDTRVIPSSWSQNSNMILYTRAGGGVYVLPLTGEKKPYPVPQSNTTSTSGVFSPDGHWVAYVSTESQRLEVYAVPFPG